MLCNDSTPAAEALCSRDYAAPNAPYCSTFPAGAQWYPVPQGAPCEVAATPGHGESVPVAAEGWEDPG